MKGGGTGRMGVGMIVVVNSSIAVSSSDVSGGGEFGEVVPVLLGDEVRRVSHSGGQEGVVEKEGGIS